MQPSFLIFANGANNSSEHKQYICVCIYKYTLGEHF